MEDLQFKNIVNDTLDLIKVGMPHSFIFDKVAKIHGMTFDYFYNKIYKPTSIQFRNSVNIKRDYVVGLHFIRYSEKINSLINVDVSCYLDERKKRLVRLVSYNNCLDFLLSKEKLIGFHSKDFKDKIKEYLPETISSNSKFSLDGLDINKLSNSEKAEFLSLLNKTKTIDVENKIFIKNKEFNITDIKEQDDSKLIENKRREEKLISSAFLIKEKVQDKTIQRKTIHDLKRILLENELEN